MLYIKKKKQNFFTSGNIISGYHLLSTDSMAGNVLSILHTLSHLVLKADV